MARFRVPVLVGTLVAVIAAGVWGFGLFGKLVEGGYQDPGSESAAAAEVAQEALGSQGDVLVIYTPARGAVDDAVLGQRVENSLNRLPDDAVVRWASYWQQKAPQFLSADKRSALAVLTLAGDDDGAKLDAYREIADRLGVEGARVQVAGAVVLSDATSRLSSEDLVVAEAISLPIVLILLLFLFGSLVAASLPLLVGACAVLGSLGILHAVTAAHDVNSFAVNVASLLGLGMAIDYGLFMVGRFREEQAEGRSPAEAVSRTVATAGRTVIFSASLLMIALGGLLFFPQGLMQSLAYGGMAAVGLAALLSLTLLPALLAVLGPRVDKLPVRLPWRRAGRPAGDGWARLARVVLRRPVLVALPILAGLLVLAGPIRDVAFGEADERVLPAAEPARQSLTALKEGFPALSTAGIQVVVRGGDAQTFAAAVAKVPGVAAVTPTGQAGGVTVLSATPRDTDPFSEGAREAVRDIRALDAPRGATVLVGGTTARNVDSLDATVDRLPLMIGLLVGATLLLMFLAFGSVLLPVKAVLMSALSLAATFGVLVWIFQDGHGAGLLGVTPAPPEVGIVVLMAAVVFGLSTDYEVFLLSRMVEARTRGATTAEAVTTGLARTGRVISAAALLLIVVTGAFALSSVTTMRFVGVGMILALILDATVVRMLLVPAVLGLMGNAAWWAPGPLRRLQERAGLAEHSALDHPDGVGHTADRDHGDLAGDRGHSDPSDRDGEHGDNDRDGEDGDHAGDDRDGDTGEPVAAAAAAGRAGGRHAAPGEAVARPGSSRRPRHARRADEDDRPAWAGEQARAMPVAPFGAPVPARSGPATPPPASPDAAAPPGPAEAAAQPTADVTPAEPTGASQPPAKSGGASQPATELGGTSQPAAKPAGAPPPGAEPVSAPPPGADSPGHPVPTPPSSAAVDGAADVPAMQDAASVASSPASPATPVPAPVKPAGESPVPAEGRPTVPMPAGGPEKAAPAGSKAKPPAGGGPAEAGPKGPAAGQGGGDPGAAETVRLSPDETETLRITTGERPTVGPVVRADEVETVDLASRRGEVAPDARAGEPDWFANGRRGAAGSNDQPRAGSRGGDGSSLSDEDGAAPTEVLNLAPDPAQQKGRDQERSPGPR